LKGLGLVDRQAFRGLHLGILRNQIFSSVVIGRDKKLMFTSEVGIVRLESILVDLRAWDVVLELVAPGPSRLFATKMECGAYLTL
jgi:hypothetical protein